MMKVFKVNQSPAGPKIEDIPAYVKTKLQESCITMNLHGQKIAVAVGSRGIKNIHLVVAAAVASLKEAGALPFIVPAMGSHGGGTAEGQLSILESLGVTSTSVGAEIRSCMDVVRVKLVDGCPILIDRNAWEADKILIINRIKEHTTFNAKFESGIFKMLGIGLGKAEGAKNYHRNIAKVGFEKTIGAAARTIIETGKVLGAIGIVENGAHEAGTISVMWPKEIEEVEERLLRLAKSFAPSLPFAHADLLILGEIGKNISGTGMDTAVTYRKNPGISPIKRIYVRSLSEGTHGNATGIGIADFCHRRVLKQIDYDKTYMNCMTGGMPEKAKIPITFRSELKCIEAVIDMLGTTKPEIMWIKNTLELHEIWVTEAYREEAEKMGLPIQLESIKTILPKGKST